MAIWQWLSKVPTQSSDKSAGPRPSTCKSDASEPMPVDFEEDVDSAASSNSKPTSTKTPEHCEKKS